MVTYTSSSASGTITIISDIVGTSLTINVPLDEIVQGVPFIIDGQLTRNDNGVPLLGETISFTWNGNVFTPTTTRNIGGVIKYETTVQINEPGTFTITANFDGSERPGLTLTPTRGIQGVRIGASMVTPLIIGVSAVLGVILLAIGLVKK